VARDELAALDLKVPDPGQEDRLESLSIASARNRSLHPLCSTM
jgi:hypothetical protein